MSNRNSNLALQGPVKQTVSYVQWNFYKWGVCVCVCFNYYAIILAYTVIIM